MKMDLHIHTCYSKTKRWGSASLIEPIQLLDKAVDLGLDCLAVTDHDEIEGSLRVAELAPDWGLVAIPAIEVSSRGGHILALGVTDMIPKGLSPAETIERIHAQNGIAVAAHPLNFVVSLSRKEVLELPIDAMETHNARSPRNRAAYWLSRSARISQTGGSDSHSIGEVGNGITDIPGRCKNYRQVIEAIRSGKSFAYGTQARYRYMAHHVIRTAAKQKKDNLKKRIMFRLGFTAA